MKAVLGTLLLLFMNFSFANTQVTYALGIPDPLLTWTTLNYKGKIIHPISGNSPASWQVAVGTGVNAYYIDNVHKKATDKNNEFGSPQRPRRTIPEITYEAGSYVEIHGGPYTGGGQLILGANGTPGKPVWIRGVSADKKALITGTTILKGQYIFLENLRYTEQSKTLQLRTHNGSSLHHVVIRNSVFSGSGHATGNGSAIAIYGGSVTQRFHDIIIYNNQISYLGNSYSDVSPESGNAPENDKHGILVRSNTDRVWILNNSIHHMGGDSVQVGVASIKDSDRVKNTFIGGNDFYDNLENAVDVKEADDTIVSTNKMRNWIQHKDNSSTGVAVVIHNAAKNTWLINNRIKNASIGITVTGGSLDTWIVGNIIEKIQHSSWDKSWNAQSLYSTGAGIHFRGGSSGGAVNNTIVNTDKGIEMTTGSYTIINNIVALRREKEAYDLQVESTKSNNMISNNIIYAPHYDVNFKNIDCQYCLYSPPNFIGAQYVLGNVSVSVAAGAPIQFLQDKFYSQYGQHLNKDIALNQRVLGGIDIGAYENTSSTQDGSHVALPNAPVIANIDIE